MAQKYRYEILTLLLKQFYLTMEITVKYRVARPSDTPSSFYERIHFITSKTSAKVCSQTRRAYVSLHRFFLSPASNKMQTVNRSQNFVRFIACFWDAGTEMYYERGWPVKATNKDYIIPKL